MEIPAQATRVSTAAHVQYEAPTMSAHVPEATRGETAKQVGTCILNDESKVLILVTQFHLSAQ